MQRHVIITLLSNNQIFRLAEHPLDARIPQSGLIYTRRIQPPRVLGWGVIDLNIFAVLWSLLSLSLSMHDGEEEEKVFVTKTGKQR